MLARLAPAALAALLGGCAAAGVSDPTPGVTRSVKTAATDRSIDIPSLPATVEQFIALRDQTATTPAGGAAMFCVAMLVYTKDEKLGQACLTIAVDQGRLASGGNGHQGKQLAVRDLQQMQMQVGDHPYIAASYIDDTDPEAGYALPPLPWEIRLNGDEREVDADRTKVFVYSSGADSARPITLRKNDKGFWKADEWSSLVVGVRPPPKARPKDDF
jgi:hypothetical protein